MFSNEARTLKRKLGMYEECGDNDDADSSNGTATEALLNSFLPGSKKQVRRLKWRSTPLLRTTLRLEQVKMSSGRQSQL